MLVTYSYYTTDYKGEAIIESEFDRLNLRAEDDVENMSSKDLDDLETWEEEFVKKAICSQIEYYYMNGDTYNDNPAVSEGIGKFNYSLGSKGSAYTVLSPRSKSYLGKTNLLYRGCIQ